MKKLFLTLITILLVSSGLFAQTTFLVDGTARDSATNLPVANLKVYIYSDSSMNYYEVLTDANGYYSQMVTYPANTFIVTMISYFDCNNKWHFLFSTGGGGITFNFFLCTSNPLPCQASFYSLPDSSSGPNGPFGYHFTNTSAGNPMLANYQWSFGDGGTSSAPNPNHAYSSPGNYIVCLTTSANGCTSTFCDTINVGFQTYNCGNYFVSHTIQGATYFASFVQGPSQNVTYLWNFGDNTTSMLMCPFHIYSQSGTYTVTLTTTDMFGCSSTSVQNLLVATASTCNANYTYIQDSLNNLTFHFFDLSIGGGTSWYWDFGDGTTSNLINPTHTYQAPGVYWTYLTITNTQTGCTDNHLASVTVGSGPSLCSNFFTYGTQLMYASFYGFTGSGTAPFTYSWSFGDGTGSNIQNPSHTYASQGNYIVSLTTEDATGCIYTSTQTITISNSTPTSIWGQVSAGNVPIDHGQVLLYTIDPVGGAFYVSDTAIIDSAGFYWFSNVFPGNYAIFAELTANSSLFGQYVPTYYGNTIFWGTASQITLGQTFNPYNIELQAVIPPFFGPGNITGTIVSGNKLFGSGTPLPDIEIMLLDMSNNPLLIDYSDLNGNFNFNNLPYGTYKVYAEVGGINTNPAIISLISSNPNQNNINLVMTPSGITTGIDDDPAIETIQISKLYPNPASGIISIEMNAIKAGSLSLTISDIIGNTVLSQSATLNPGSNSLSINTSEIAAGSYLLKGLNTNGYQFIRKIAIVR